jgi:GDP/UDP-N,N'-diacetylbacillosamine 2-epimerase (hydrolysing)
MAKIALLTSSRADYSIYYPLIKKITNEPDLLLDIIAFGNHNSLVFGNSAQKIEKDGFHIKYKVEALILGESPESIADSMGMTMIKFSAIWKTEHYNLIICLGDRYEMFAAVSSSIPFNIPVAHISGGEVTLGAIDNIFRDSLTLMSRYHFTSTEQYKERVIEIIGENNRDQVYNVGGLSIDNLKNLSLFSLDEFKQKFHIDLSKDSILITFHPETVSFEKNEEYINELIETFKTLDHYQLIITMPNTDTMGNFIRQKLLAFIETHDNAIGIESFGTLGYLTCMKYCKFLLGNTSSGFVEASFFPKFVINLGDRQKGRIETPNIYTTLIKKETILETISNIENTPIPDDCNIYGDGMAADKILHTLKTILC